MNYAYDDLNRLTGVSGAFSESYSYDPNTGNLSAKAGVSYQYNAQVTCPAGSRTLAHAVSTTGSSTLTYDCNGNMTGRNVGSSYNLTYDAENRLTNVSGAVTASYGYDGDGKRVKNVNAYQNLAGGAPASSDTSLYNPDVVTNGDTWADNANQYATGGSGLHYAQLDLGAVYSVDKVKVWHYAADGRTYHNTKTQVSEDGTSWYTVFDSATQGEYPETPAGKTHTFTARNVRYVRDWLNGNTVNVYNHWVEIEVWGTATTAYLGNYFEWTGSANTMVKYYYAGSQRAALRRGSTLNYLFGDHLGSTSLTVDNVTGRKLTELRYKPWGENRFSTGSTPTSFRFTGQRSEDYIKLIQMGSRWYDSELGRFISPDPIVPGIGEGGNPNAVGYLGAYTYSSLTVDFHENQLLDQLNTENRNRLQNPDFKLPPVPTNSIAFDRYAYSLNNPVRYVDPSGHFALLAALALITPAGWVVLGVATVATVAFVATGGPEALGEALSQAGEAVSNGLNAFFARPKSNQAQNRQFDGAVKELQRQLGRVLSLDEVRELHEALHDAEDPGFWDIVEEGLNLFDKGEGEKEESGDD